MPAISNFIRNAFGGSAAVDSNPPSASSSRSSSRERSLNASRRDITTHYLSTPLSGSSSHYSEDAIQSIASTASKPITIPPATLIYTLVHPDPSHSEDTEFFLQCLPYPIGYLHHCSSIITSHLSPRAKAGSEPPVWRHQHLTLHIDRHYHGLAATSGGHVRLSLRWIGDIHTQHRQHTRSLADAAKEFKGVILHELVHAIQHDGYGTTPGWLIESIADWVRLRAGLGPSHWREAGQGKSAEERGWEEGYDSGARFLDWLVGEENGQKGNDRQSAVASDLTGDKGQSPFARYYADDVKLNDIGQVTAPTATSDAPPQAQSTSINPPTAANPPPRPLAPHHRQKSRRGPFPDFVRDLDSRLVDRQFRDAWWEEMTGTGLKVLWGEYMAYYR